ncbi:DUF2059 domain-containing protein [Loktanella sp. F6476L]|uniref:DUF2059 domain-containing protein n=1 Tax=Loktanella sp. F6476L TaxID=2926405 RepID=UPI001FF1A95D|nr:DUF2059 domain-containing protein [Loktanella sp. F6476L]MCK0121443.1 DUF2059 domain-containing protein [Loktanella sp. F6476L]
MLTRLTFAAALALTPAISFANVAKEDVANLFAAMDLDAIVSIMREEGLEYGEQIAEDLFPDRTSSDWPETVSQIYDYDTMRDGLEMQFGAALGDVDIDSLIAFFEGDVGQTVVGLEVAARRALMDEDIEEASKEAAAVAIADETPRFSLVEEFVETNDLVETNVVGALNANYAFYLGLLDGGAFGQDLTEEQILTDVWNQETEIRKNTYEWVYSYLLMAYQPLSDAELQAYIDFSETEDGQALNTALFVAFDEMFEGISRALGLASSQYMAGQDL